MIAVYTGWWGEGVWPPSVFVSVLFLHPMQRRKSMLRILAAVKKMLVRQEGATMVEYGLMLFLIAVVCLTAIALIGTNLSTMFDRIAASL
jgi:pilus assembly protein Flp/PilA